MRRITHRNMKFVRRNDSKTGIPELPPELMPNRGDLKGGSRSRSILDRVDHSGSSEKKYNHDQNRNDRPGQLNLCAPIHLGRLAPSIRDWVAEFHHDIRQQAGHNEEYHPGDGEDEKGQTKNGLRGCRVRFKYVGNRVVAWRIRGTQPGSQKNPGQEDKYSHGPAGDCPPFCAARRPEHSPHSLPCADTFSFLAGQTSFPRVPASNGEMARLKSGASRAPIVASARRPRICHECIYFRRRSGPAA